MVNNRKPQEMKDPRGTEKLKIIADGEGGAKYLDENYFCPKN
jgi:hypothetical protein